MATYPTIPQHPSTTRSPISNKKIDVSADGTIRARIDYSVIIYDFSIKHSMISTSLKDNIMTFYDTNDSVNFTFNYSADLVDYTLMFEEEPVPTWIASDVWDVEFKAKGIKL